MENYANGYDAKEQALKNKRRKDNMKVTQQSQPDEMFEQLIKTKFISGGKQRDKYK